MKCCADCGVSVMKEPLHRSNPKGESPAVWKCIKCIDPVLKPSEARLEMTSLLADQHR